MQYNSNLWPNHPKFPRCPEIAVVSAVNRPAAVTWTLNDSVGHNLTQLWDRYHVPQNVFLVCVCLIGSVLLAGCCFDCIRAYNLCGFFRFATLVSLSGKNIHRRTQAVELLEGLSVIFRRKTGKTSTRSVQWSSICTASASSCGSYWLTKYRSETVPTEQHCLWPHYVLVLFLLSSSFFFFSSFMFFSFRCINILNRQAVGLLP